MALRELEPRKESSNSVDFAYLNLLQDILENGTDVMERTGTGTRKVFGRILKVDLNEGFPLLTTKRVWWKGVAEELLWFIDSGRNIQPLVRKGVHIWDEWPFQKYLEAHGQAENYPKNSEAWEAEMKRFTTRVAEDNKFAEQWGDLGAVYGFQWREWLTRNGGKIDQLGKTIQTIIQKPQDRRMLVTAWNPEDADNCALPPCHFAYLFDVTDHKLNCMMFQRSVDTFLGLPFNIASYALLTNIVAKVTNLEPGELTLALGNTHLYLNHLDQARLQLTRNPKPLPQLIFTRNITSIDDLSMEDFILTDYNPHPSIKAPISV